MATTHERISVAFLIGAALLSIAAPAIAQPPPPAVNRCTPRGAEPLFTGFHLYEENDSLPLAGGDERYSQGLRVSVSVNRTALPCWVQRARRWKLPGRLGDLFEPSVTLFLGQGLYTPRIITWHVLEPNDRGFADFNYVGAEMSLTANSGRFWVRHAAEVTAGVLGWAALGKGAQGGLHSLKLSRVPKGWSSDGPLTPAANLQLRTEVLFRYSTASKYAPDFDLTAGPILEVGNVRTSAGGQAIARVGWNLTGFAPGGIRLSAAPGAEGRFFEIGGLFGVEGRALANTSLVRSTPGSVGFSTKTWVHDRRLGAFVRFGGLRASYIRVDRSPEFTTAVRSEGRQRFGAATVSYEPGIGARTPMVWHMPWVQAEVGMGRSFGGPKVELGTATSPKPQGNVAGQLALRVKLWRGLHISGELASVSVEGTPIADEPENRSDVMLRQLAATVGWTSDVGVGTLGVRAGAAVKSTARIQTIRHPIIDGRVGEVPANVDYPVGGGGLLVGAQFFPHLERHIAIGVDVTYHRFGTVTGMPGLLKPSYLKTIILLQLRTD